MGKKPIPLTPSTQRTGGMLDDVIAKITEARAVEFDYEGKVTPGVPAIRISLEDEEGDDLSPQHYKAGSPEKVQPTDDGLNFEAVDEDDEYEGIGKKTLAGTFLRLLNEVSEGAFEKYSAKVGDLTCLEGIVARFKQVPKPKTGMGDGDFPVITEIIEAPWGKSGGKKGGKDAASKKSKAKQKAMDDEEDEDEEEDEEEEAPPAKSKKKKKPAPPVDEDEDEEESDDDEDEESDEETEEEEESEEDIPAKATKALRGVVKSAGAPISVTKAANLVKAAVEDEDDDWRDIMTQVMDAKFLKAGAKAGRWSYDGTKVGPAKK